MFHSAPSSTHQTVSRVLALDVGTRRIGMAISDESGMIATGLDSIQRRSLKDDLGRIARIAGERKAALLLVGLPVHMSGDESPMSAKVRGFAAKLERETGLPVVLFDERLTSVQAEELLRERGLSLKRLLEEKRNGAVDRLAAVLLLEDWLRNRAGNA